MKYDSYSEIEIITWSRYSASLLACFGFNPIIKDGGFIIEDNNKEVFIPRESIVDFLKSKGVRIKLEKKVKKMAI
jgi:hypothetical protein